MSDIESTEPVTEPVEPAAAAPQEPEPKVEAKPNIWDAPETAKAEIERLRRENGAARTNAKAQAAEEARNELAQTIGKALGIVKDDTPVDPAVLTQQVEQSNAMALQARIENATMRAAIANSANPLALLDSVSFLKEVAALDPNDSDGYAAAVRKAVETNPLFGQTPTAPGMKPNPAQGRSASPPATLAERIAAAQAAGDTKTAVRLKASMALDPNSSF